MVAGWLHPYKCIIEIIVASQPASQQKQPCTQPMAETELPSYQAFLILAVAILAAPSSHVRNTTNYRNTRSKEDSLVFVPENDPWRHCSR
jgi:hypothetical protein